MEYERQPRLLLVGRHDLGHRIMPNQVPWPHLSWLRVTRVVGPMIQSGRQIHLEIGQLASEVFCSFEVYVSEADVNHRSSFKVIPVLEASCRIHDACLCLKSALCMYPRSSLVRNHSGSHSTGSRARRRINSIEGEY